MEPSTKPYLLRAIHDWCTDAGFTPYVAVAVDDSVRVPPEFVKNGEIVLNISTLATSRLTIGNEAIELRARFGGVARDVYVPIGRVAAIYARENGQGMAFEVTRTAPAGVEAAGSALESGATERAPVVASPSPAETSDGEGGRAQSQPPRPGDRPRLTRVK